MELGHEVKVALDGLHNWESEATAGALRFVNKAQGLTLTVKRLPFGKTALTGEVRLTGQTGTYVYSLAVGKDFKEETLRWHLVRLGFANEPVMALLDRLIPIIRNFLLLEMPEG